jgi:hypothetical protein
MRGNHEECTALHTAVIAKTIPHCAECGQAWPCPTVDPPELPKQRTRMTFEERF